MGLYPIDCPLCKKPFLWFSGSIDSIQLCGECRKPKSLTEQILKAAELPPPHDNSSMAVYAGHTAENNRLKPLILALAECADALDTYKYRLESSLGEGRLFIEATNVLTNLRQVLEGME